LHHGSTSRDLLHSGGYTASALRIGLRREQQGGRPRCLAGRPRRCNRPGADRAGRPGRHRRTTHPIAVVLAAPRRVLCVPVVVKTPHRSSPLPSRESRCHPRPRELLRSRTQRALLEVVGSYERCPNATRSSTELNAASTAPGWGGKPKGLSTAGVRMAHASHRRPRRGSAQNFCP
jgi:hypothetical protein